MAIIRETITAEVIVVGMAIMVAVMTKAGTATEDVKHITAR
jgi:hypothetical protein